MEGVVLDGPGTSFATMVFSSWRSMPAWILGIGLYLLASSIWGGEAISSDIARLKQFVFSDLSDPDSCRLANGRPDAYRLIGRLKLACGWTDPDFQKPLLAILGGRKEVRFYAAACLLRYRSPALDAEVEKWRDENYRHHYTADIIDEQTIGELADQYHRDGSLPKFLSPLDLPDQLRRIASPDQGTRAEGYLGMLDAGVMLDPAMCRLEPTAIPQRSKHGSDLASLLSHLLVGADRAVPFVHGLRSAAKTDADRNHLTALLWRLGSNDDEPAARSLISDIIERCGADEDPPFERWGILYDLCGRPDIRHLDLYQRLLACRSSSFRSLGWNGWIGLDQSVDPQALAGPWDAALASHSADDVLCAIATLAEHSILHRDAWLDWLVVIQPQIPVDWFAYPSWIDAISAQAGRDFGFNGRMFPHGFNAQAADQATKAALAWYEAYRKKRP